MEIYLSQTQPDVYAIICQSEYIEMVTIFQAHLVTLFAYDACPSERVE